MMTHLEITDTAGNRWVGDAVNEAMTDEERAGVAEMFSNFKTLNYISLVIGGAKHYFNPEHIVAAALVEVD